MQPQSSDRDASLRLLRGELQSLGMVVVPREDGLEVRLSTFETVRIRLADSVLQCETRFGAVSRTRARWTFSILSSVLVPGLFLTSGLTAGTVSVAFLVVLAAVSQAVRFTVTESIVSRIQMVWLNVRGLPSSVTPREAPGLKGPAFNADADLRNRARGEEEKARPER